MQIRERLRILRDEAKLTQPQLARRLGVNQQWVSRRETGETDITVEEAIRIAEALGKRAGFVIADPGTTGDLVEAAKLAQPDTVAAAVQLMQRLDELDGQVRALVLATVRTALSQARAAS